MATAKKKTTPAKSTPRTKAPAKKPASTKAIPADREQKLAEQALGFVDEAARILRIRIREGATQTAKGRIAAKKKASTLLNKASTSLTRALESGTKSLDSLLKKL